MPDNREDPPVEDVESDSRFPSGPWKGFFLQPSRPGRHWMELRLTFKRGKLTGDGQDWVGVFLFHGRYDTKTGKCSWSKQYVGKHAIQYDGYNEGKGIWGVWQFNPDPRHRGGFHIWPVGMGDPTGDRLAEELEEPMTLIDASTLEVAGVGVGD